MGAPRRPPRFAAAAATRLGSISMFSSPTTRPAPTDVLFPDAAGAAPKSSPRTRPSPRASSSGPPRRRPRASAPPAPRRPSLPSLPAPSGWSNKAPLLLPPGTKAKIQTVASPGATARAAASDDRILSSEDVRPTVCPVTPTPASPRQTLHASVQPRMDDYMVALNDASVSISGEGLLDAADAVGRADSSMSASAAPPPVPRKAGRNKQPSFSAYEDNLLCKFWLEIGNDAITNTGQRKEAFWRRVVERYNSVGQGKYPKRSHKSIMSRWEYIKAEVNKFSGYMAEMIRSNPSGMSDADKVGGCCC